MGFGKDGKGVIIGVFESTALGTLAQNTALIIGTAPAILERFRMLKWQGTVGVSGLTALEGGGLSMHIVDGDYSLAEFEASMEQNGPLGPNDKVTADIVERFHKEIAVLDDSIDSALTMAMMHGKENAPLIEEVIRWTFARTKSWNMICYNKGPALTTGATLRYQGKAFGVWVL